MLTDTDAGFDLAAYLGRIGFTGEPAPDLRTLMAICRLHPMAIPFENLTPLTGGAVTLDIESLQAKLVGARRGGYCYEHNTLLAHALEAIGFSVTGLAARVLFGQPEDAVTPQSHMALRVRLDDADWLADGGFGGLTLTAPMRLTPDVEQRTPHESFRFVQRGDNLLQEVKIGADWRATFLLEPAPRFRPDYEIVNYWVSTHPASPFTSRLIVSRPFDGGRRVLHDLRLSEYRPGQAPVQRMLGSIAELESALEDMFGLAIPDRAALRRAAAGFAAR